MATTTAATRSLPTRTEAPRVNQRKLRPIVAWAALGALFWALQTFVLIKWLTGPFFTPVESGPDDPPNAMKVAMVTYLILQGALFVYLLGRLVVRPWLRERRLTFDGIMLISFWGFYWFWDPLANATGLFFTYNAWLPNMGSWTTEIPGWNTPGSPGAQVAEPFFFGVYGAVYVPLIIGGCWVMKKLREKYGFGNFGVISVAFAIFFIAEIVIELIWMRVGLYTYAGSIKSLTLFPDHYYAMPLYEALWAIPVTALCFLRFSRDDKGRTIAERGIDDVNVRGPKNTIRLLAVTGAFYTAALLYFIPIWAFSMHSEYWPKDVTSRSYMTDYLCGPGTTRACPGDNVPKFTPDSVTITPEGKLFVPEGSRPVRQIAADGTILGK